MVVSCFRSNSNSTQNWLGSPIMGKRPSYSNAAGSEDLHRAAREGDLQTVQSICNSNPLAINSRDKLSRTPLHLAAWAGQTEVVSYLCKNKAEVGAGAIDNMGAIHLASQKGHLEVVRILLSSGVSVRVSSSKGLTALHYAVQGSHLDLVKYLVKKGANIGAKTKSGKKPVDFAKSEEIRLFLVECEESTKKNNEVGTGSKEAEDFASKGSTNNKNAAPDGKDVSKNEEEVDGKGNENVDVYGEKQIEDEEFRDESEKMDEEAKIEGNSNKPKKPRVELNHLLAKDDIEEEEL